jgi:DNA-binding transcriptional regulator YhcF (GntR family)
MRLWINRRSEVPIREQLATQIRQAVLSGDLTPEERLPSTRELARRFDVHPNTVSAAYLLLEREGWLEARRGSGVFVHRQPPAGTLSPEVAVYRLIEKMAAEAAALGAAAEAVRAVMRRWLDSRPPTRWLVVEPDAELRGIVQRELAGALKLPVDGCSLEECRVPGALDAAMAVAMPSRERLVREALPPAAHLHVAQASSISFSLAQYLPAPQMSLVGVASGWPDFLKIAATMLTAAGLPAEALLLRDATRRGWQRGLSETAAVICDVVTASRLPAGCRAIPFRLVSEATLARLRQEEARLAAGEAL